MLILELSMAISMQTGSSHSAGGVAEKSHPDPQAQDTGDGIGY